ncbi:hypothetical protein H5123_14865 [Shewanella sp. SR43-4]|uniref:hypothetical protein n=2 Tax=Shewanella TaxID=22 RepID=UPI0015F9254B|nr:MULTISPECIES: hypothetical protein [unclassified Shewanella]MBB1318913.1 hypothetical protein [Shewanella sp. SR43-4]MBB1477164.1 hypothetical protein [Shewanella sp. SG41-3]|tara:strand:+ start:605 stop:1048 length:444 start_codon:yes stop_codon:yes gene_type:complete
MAINMCKPKLIGEVTLEDLQSHRWCFYQNDEEGFDAFEHVIPDTHPDFSADTIELELAEFKFANGKVALGIYDGASSFTLVANDQGFSFWYGVVKPEQKDIESMSNFLLSNDYQLPVEATAKWSRTTKKYSGIQYINKDGEIIELSI